MCAFGFHKIFNLLLSFSIYFGTITFGAGLPSPVIAPGVVIVQIPLPNAAAQGVLKPGDVIVGMNGSPMMSLSRTNTGADAQRAISKFIAQIRATPDGEDIQLQVLRNSAGKADLWKDNDDNYAQLLQHQQVVSVKPQRTSATAAQTIGVLLGPNLIENKVLQSNNPIEAAGMAVQYAATLTKETAIGLASFFGQLLTPFSGGSSSSVSQISGPIGLIKTGTEVIATSDIRNVLLFAAAISINLGVVNAFPLPALDGGQFIFVLAEAITSRKVDQRLQEGITGASLLFLLLISAGAAIGDIGSIIGF
jgi:RIP metalloprotease RseP